MTTANPVILKTLSLILLAIRATQRAIPDGSQSTRAEVR
jgi:hypothetical protein